MLTKTVGKAKKGWPKGKPRKKSSVAAKQPEAVSPFKGMTDLKVNLGCGPDIRPGYVNIDKFHDEGIYVHDLESGRLPFDDNSVAEVQAHQVLEHIQNFIPLMNEINRVLVHGGYLHLSVPQVPHVEAFQDPTHVRFFTGASFDYFIRGNFYYEQVGITYGIEPFSWKVQNGNGWNLVVAMRK